VAIALWPLCVYRVLRSAAIADGPAVFVMMAPVPFVTLGVFALMRKAGVIHVGDAPDWLRLVVNCLVILNITNLLSTALAAVVRRRSLRASLWPLSPAWASLTFPLVSNCTVSVLLANYYNPFNCTRHCVSWAMATTYWTRGLIPITLLAVPLTDLAWLLHLPRWLCCLATRPRQPSSIDLPPEEARALLGGLDAHIGGRVRGHSAALQEGAAPQESPISVQVQPAPIEPIAAPDDAPDDADSLSCARPHARLQGL